MNRLQISSDKAFYSLQGEGATLGVPAVFLRLAGCTLDCGWCDTAAVWKNGTNMTFQEVWALLIPFIGRLNEGAHLVLTGGSPLRQQKALAEFIATVRLEYPHSQSWYVECETEGVLEPDEMIPYVAQWNVSPKLANSGMAFERRFKPQVLRHHSTTGKAFFKFPVDVSKPDAVQGQLDEIDAIRAMCGINKRYVWLMPVCNDRASHATALPLLAEIAKKTGYCLSARLHLEIWNQATGV